MKQNSYISMQNICKSFSGVKVLDNVNLEIPKGDVHAIVGENGAGKSTLMKVLAGIYQADSGEVYLDGQRVHIRDARDGLQHGISFVHQELSMIPGMTITQNFFLGSEIQKHFFLNEKEMDKKAQEVLDSFGLRLSPHTPVDTLSVAQQQLVEIARAISFDSKIIIMDEPTASLTNSEVKALFDQISRLKAMGITIIFISHKIDELLQICDGMTVLRDGKFIASKSVKELTKSDIINMMVGREMGKIFPEHETPETGVIFSAKNLVNKKLHDISFDLKEGEILGLAGLVGAGRTELAQAIFGIDYLVKGKLYLNGKEISQRSPRQAIKNGFALVPEDRKVNGLVLRQSVRYNMILSIVERIYKFFFKDHALEKSTLETYFEKMSIKANGYGQDCESLSGGNQQKVVFAKNLATDPKVIILDEPTRGIDVGAKSEIYNIIVDLTKKGMSVILISSEMEEILSLSDRILIMHEGKLMKEMDSDDPEFNEVDIMRYAIGGVSK